MALTNSTDDTLRRRRVKLSSKQTNVNFTLDQEASIDCDVLTRLRKIITQAETLCAAPNFDTFPPIRPMPWSEASSGLDRQTQVTRYHYLERRTDATNHTLAIFRGYKNAGPKCAKRAARTRFARA